MAFLSSSVGDGSGGLGDLQALVLAQGDLGIERGLDGELHSLVLAELHVADGGLAHDLVALVQNGFFIDVGEDLLHRVGIEDLGAVEILDHPTGRLALAEAGDRNKLAVLEVGLLQAALELLLLNGDDDLQIVVFFGCALDDHGCFLLYGNGRNAVY